MNQNVKKGGNEVTKLHVLRLLFVSEVLARGWPGLKARTKSRLQYTGNVWFYYSASERSERS